MVAIEDNSFFMCENVCAHRGMRFFAAKSIGNAKSFYLSHSISGITDLEWQSSGRSFPRGLTQDGKVKRPVFERLQKPFISWFNQILGRQYEAA